MKCLESRYNRPRLIHKTRVRKICEVPPLKDGNGKELRRLHDVLQQHLRALKSMDHEPSGSFITSMIELKLDQSTMFEWQKFSQKSTDVPHYELLEFLNLRTQACKTCTPNTKRTPRSDAHPNKKPQSLTSQWHPLLQAPLNLFLVASCASQKSTLYMLVLVSRCCLETRWCQ